MEVTENDIARIPVRNLRVPRAEFVAVWAAAERLCREQGELDQTLVDEHRQRRAHRPPRHSMSLHER